MKHDEQQMIDFLVTVTKSKLCLFMIVVFITTFSSCKQSNDNLPCIDVRKSYPEKEMLLTDIADVTYLCLKSDDDDFLFRGYINHVTKNTIVIHDISSGNILFFSKDGIPKSRFNHKGNGPEDYLNAQTIIYDEAADDVFIQSSSSVLQVYSSTGDYKRKIVLPIETMMNPIVSFDDQSFVLYDASIQFVPDRKREITEDTDFPAQYYSFPFVRISKIDGKVLDYMELPSNSIVLKDDRVFQEMGGIPGHTSRVIKCVDGVFLCNPETDTVFLYGQDKSLTPIICKTPLVSVLEPMVYLNNCIDKGGRYQFMEVFTVRWEEESFPFPAKYYMRDKKTGEIFRQKIILPDFTGKEIFISPRQSGRHYEHGVYYELELIELKQAYRENRLSGKLKELVAALNEDEDNNVFMLVNFK